MTEAKGRRKSNAVIGTAKTTNTREMFPYQKKSPESVLQKRLSGRDRRMKFVAGWDQERFDSALDKEMRPLPSRKSPIVTYRISMNKIDEMVKKCTVDISKNDANSFFQLKSPQPSKQKTLIFVSP